MALVALNVALNGNAQQLGAGENTPILWIQFDNPTGNGGVDVGTSTVATVPGTTVAAGEKQVIGPFSQGAPINLEEIYVKGTNAQTLKVLYITY